MASDRLYLALRPIVDFATRCHYASVTIRGTERLPQDGGYIIAPCHQNALMEPLLVLLLSRRAVYHICRGDIFANPTVAKILEFMKILPVFRWRDGVSQLGKNQQTFDRSKEVLLQGYPLSIMAEGRHTDRHQLLPLVKGVFRIAGTTQKQMGDRPLYIVPLGIDLDYYERPFSHAVVNVGEPIDVRQYMALFEDDEPQALNVMRRDLTDAMHAAMYHVDSVERYETDDALCNILNADMRRQLHLPNSPYGRFVARQKVSISLAKLDHSEDVADRERLADLRAMAKERLVYCKKHHVSIQTVASPVGVIGRMVRIVSLLLVVALLFWQPSREVVLFALLCYPLHLLPTHLVVRKVIDDPQFRSSINFGVRFVLALLYVPIVAVVNAFNIGWWFFFVSIAVSLLMARFMPIVLDWWRRIVR